MLFLYNKHIIVVSHSNVWEVEFSSPVITVMISEVCSLIINVDVQPQNTADLNDSTVLLFMIELSNLFQSNIVFGKRELL